MLGQVLARGGRLPCVDCARAIATSSVDMVNRAAKYRVRSIPFSVKIHAMNSVDPRPIAAAHLRHGHAAAPHRRQKGLAHLAFAESRRFSFGFRFFSNRLPAEFRQQQPVTLTQDEIVRRFIRGFFPQHVVVHGNEVGVCSFF